MKVNYRLKSRLKHPHLRRIFILIAIFIFGAIIFSFADKVIISFISPVWQAENVIARSLRNGATFLRTQKTLSEENIVLKEKLSSLELRILSLSNEEAQKDTLFELIGREREPNIIVAAVLTHPPQTPYDIIIIDAGSNDSIAIGSTVSLPEGPSLGIISRIFSGKAQVKLFSANGEETNAVLERNSIPVTLVGIGGGNFKLAIPYDVAIEKGDRILSLDIVSRLLATVGKINVRPTDSFKEILAKSPTNIFTLRFVFITP